MTDKKTLLDEIIDTVKLEGFEEKTEPFERRRRQLHVLKCRELRGLVSCLECNYCDKCELYARVKFDHEFAK